MRVTASDGKRTATAASVWANEPQELPVPIHEIDTLDSIAMGFRTDMLEIKDEQGNGGDISTCAGFGGEGIILQWKDGKNKRQAVIRGSDLLIAWVATFDRENAEAMRKAQP